MNMIEPRVSSIRSRMGAVVRGIYPGIFAAVLFALPGGTAAGQGIDCGSFYRISPGDTLHKIAMRAYGEGDYQAIFDANRDILPDISRIEVGDELLIPCLDGTGPASRREALASGAEGAADTPLAEASAAAIRPVGDGIGFLTGPDFAPFAGPDLPGGGMITELIRLSLARTVPESEVNVTFDGDWPSHLGLISQGAYDLGFPWYRPDCTRAERLDQPMQRRCADFDFSAPLFEVAIGYYVRAGDPLAGAAGHDRLFGRNICRPAGYFTFDLDQEGLREPKVKRVFPPAAADCFTWLIRGEVDVVTLSRPIADADIASLGLGGLVAEIPALASVQTLHAVAPKGDPQGRAYLDLLNTGLAELMSSGRWFEVVSRHLGAYGVSIR